MIKIEQRQIGLIIGQQGKNIKELYKQTHCDILLPRARRKKTEYDDISTSTFIVDEYEEQWNDTDFYYVYDAYNEAEHSNIKLNVDPQSTPKSKPKQNQKSSKHKKGGQDDGKSDGDDDELDMDDPRRLIEITLRGSPEEIRDAEVEIGFMV